MPGGAGRRFGCGRAGSGKEWRPRPGRPSSWRSGANASVTVVSTNLPLSSTARIRARSPADGRFAGSGRDAGQLTSALTVTRTAANGAQRTITAVSILQVNVVTTCVWLDLRPSRRPGHTIQKESTPQLKCTHRAASGLITRSIRSARVNSSTQRLRRARQRQKSLSCPSTCSSPGDFTAGLSTGGSSRSS